MAKILIKGDFLLYFIACTEKASCSSTSPFMSIFAIRESLNGFLYWAYTNPSSDKVLIYVQKREAYPLGNPPSALRVEFTSITLSFISSAVIELVMRICELETSPTTYR